MDYSPINYRRMDWFKFTYGATFPWRDLYHALYPQQAALVRASHRGYLGGK